MIKKVRTSELFHCKPQCLKAFFDESEYPWQLLPKIKEIVMQLHNTKIEGYSFISDGVLIGEGVTIHKSAVIIPPAVIGKGTEIRPGAFLRGNVIIGEGCVIGNSSELKNCILLDGVQVPHYNYVGDSILGNKAHMGAGAVCSNLKSDGRAVVIHGDEEYETGLRKIGAILGDGADIGCGCVLNPGTVVGKSTTVYPLASLRGVYPENCIVKSTTIVVKRE